MLPLGETLPLNLELVLKRATARRATATPLRLEWHSEWTPSVAAAFAAMPYDPLMDVEIVRRLWESHLGKCAQRIAVFHDCGGAPVGVVPLKKIGSLSWQLLTQYLMPYARFFVLPGYTDAALTTLVRSVDCPNILFYEQPVRMDLLRPEESWVVELPATYAELMRRTDYAHNDRRCRKHAARLTAREDDFGAIPAALGYWQERWAAQGSHHTADRKEEMQAAFLALAEQGRLKTFSLHDGEELAGMQINVIGGDTLYCQVGVAREEYKKAYPGIWGLLASMEWACSNGFREVDMLRTSAHYKRAWAKAVIRSHRLVCRPWGSVWLGKALEFAKDYKHRPHNG